MAEDHVPDGPPAAAGGGAGGGLRDLDDSALLARCRAGAGAEILGEIARRHGPRIFQACRRVLGDEHDAEDALQAVFLVLLRRAPRLSSRTVLAGWLFLTARHVALRARRERDRRRQRLRAAGAEGLSVRPALPAAGGEGLALVEQALAALPAVYRDTIILRCLYGRSEQEAARELGCSRSAVSVRLARAREKLRRRLERLGLAGVGLLLAAFLEAPETRAAEDLPPGLLGRLEDLLRGRPPPSRVLALAQQEWVAGQWAFLGRLAAAGAALGGGLLLLLALWPRRDGEGAKVAAPGLGAVSPASPGLAPASAPARGAPARAEPRLLPGEMALAGRETHRGWIWQTAFTPGGRGLLTGGDDGRIVRRPLVEQEGGGFAIALTVNEARRIVFSPDGRLALCGGHDGRVRILDLDSRTERLSFAAHPDEIVTLADGRPGNPEVGALALSPDERLLLTGGMFGPVKLWDFATGRARATLDGHVGPVFDLAFAPDGRRALSGGADGALRCWDVAGAKEAWLAEHQDRVMAVAVSPDGRRGLSGGQDGSVRLWNMETGELETFLHSGRCAVWAVAFSPDGRLAAAAETPWQEGEPVVRLWEVESGRPAGLCRYPEPQLGGVVFSLGFSPDGRRLAAGRGFTGLGEGHFAKPAQVLIWELPGD